MPAIEVEELSVRYRGQDDYALHDVSLSVDEGEFVGVVGKAGAGKTTLLSSMCGIIPFQITATCEGEVRVKGRTIEKYGTLYNLSSDVSMVLDTPDNQLFNIEVFDEVIWGVENMGFDREEVIERGEKALRTFGLEGFEERITYNLSGGEKQKVAIASVYAMDPDIILLDEPTSQLDPIGTESVFNAIDQLIDEGVTIVMVEHKIEELVQFADRIVHLQDGAVSRIADPRSFFDTRQRGSPNLAGEIDPPQVMKLGQMLRNNNRNVTVPLTLEEAIEEFNRHLKRDP